MLEYIKSLANKNTPDQAHIFVFIVVCLLLGLSVFILSIASLFIIKPLYSYIGIILPHLIGLVGWNISKNTNNMPHDDKQ